MLGEPAKASLVPKSPRIEIAEAGRQAYANAPPYFLAIGYADPGGVLPTLTVWDNRQVLHNPINDYHGYRRVMHRITLKGDVPA